MKLYFLILTLLIGTTACRAQGVLKKPTIGQVQGVTSLAPGTIKIEVIPLIKDFRDEACEQGKKKIPLKVAQVISSGSGLINMLAQGDSLNVRILNESLLIENLSSGDTLHLKEQHCFFEESYFTLIKKE